MTVKTIIALLIGIIAQLYFFPTSIGNTGVREIHIWNLSIGQGDSIFIVTPEQRTILVDGGPDGEDTLRALQHYRDPLEHSIDIMILSHPHKDHIQGLFTILERQHVGMIIAPNSDEHESLYLGLKKKAQELHVPWYIGNAGTDIQVDSYTTIDILSPTMHHKRDKNINNNSLTFMLHSGQWSGLFMGDAEISLEHELLEEGYDLHTSFVKGGHHGSKTATSNNLLNASEPHYVVFSNGIGNTFGHPHAEVLERLKEKQIPFWNTSLSGTVQLDCPILETTCIISPNEHEDS